MATWIYAYLHQIHTRNTQVAYHEEGPRFYVIEETSGSRIIEGVQTTLSALNAVGAGGWLVQLSETWPRRKYFNDQAERLVDERLSEMHNKFEATGGSIYLMRRPGLENSRLDN